MRVKIKPGERYFLALMLSTAVSGSLLAAAMLSDRQAAPTYLIWNLFLAWIPYLLALILAGFLRRKNWSDWLGLALSAIWLAFLPNSFYMVSDFIHLSEIGPDHTLFYSVIFSAFIITALALGLGSLYIVHSELRKRLSGRSSWLCVFGIIFICSVAIYIGRDLRWNSWDVLFDPAGLLFDLSSRLLDPTQYMHILGVTVPFFALITIVYILAWQAHDLR